MNRENLPSQQVESIEPGQQVESTRARREKREPEGEGRGIIYPREKGEG